jgi:hypothetical protein
MYWLASASTMSSSSSSRWPDGTIIFLVITIAAGSASATLRFRLPRRLWARLSASATRSRLAMLPSVTTSADERFDRIALEAVGTLAGFGELDELDGGRADVDANQRRVLRLERVQDGIEFI